MKKGITLSLFFLVFILYGYYLSQFDISQVKAPLELFKKSKFHDYKGVTNVSSNLSLGTGSYRDIIQAAESADLDFVIMTDLDITERLAVQDSYANKVLVIYAAKNSYLDSRILTYNANEYPLATNLGSVQTKLMDMLSQFRDENGDSPRSEFLVLTHPFRKGYQWSGDYPVGLNGIEVVNLKDMQQNMWEKSKLSSLWSLFVYPFNSSLSFARLLIEPEVEMKLWDDLNIHQKVIGHLGLEATAKAIPFTGAVWSFPSYETLFKLASLHIFTRSELIGNHQKDKIKIMQSLKQGAFYFSIDVFGETQGFSTYLKDSKVEYLMGSQIKFNKNQKIIVELPAKPTCDFEIKIIKNGNEEFNFDNQVKVEYEIKSAGIYRVMVRLKPHFPFPDHPRWITWIYTNPFYVLK